MTLNAVISRLRTIALAHKQVRRFAYTEGSVSELLTDKTNSYPAVFLQGAGGKISLGQHASALNYKLWFVDLVHVAQDTKTNETDVHSDMISVAMDILAQMNHGNYTDWRISGDNNLQLVTEEDGDMYAGCAVDVSIDVIFKQNVCAVPTNLIEYGSEPEVVIDEGQTLILKAFNTGARVRVRIHENTDTNEVEFYLDKL